MPWQWVDNLFETKTSKSRAYWDAQCPYQMCPSNQPFRRAHKPRLKFIHKITPFVHQYKCKDCGNLFNDGTIENNPEELKRMNPALYGRNPDYKFHV